MAGEKKAIRLPEELNSTKKKGCTFGSGLIGTG